ncbi:MAG: alpha/beta hydrolase [Termitinemataceae bacterium]|nr:MAG: alpha/beta hydrolase [Termitinemataceae bacterium]
MDITFLVHGFLKTGKDMYFLSNYLTQCGIANFAVTVPARFGSVDDCVQSLHKQIDLFMQQHKDESITKINFVGHSMGGLVIRKYIQVVKPKNVGRCICIATPHKGTIIASVGRILAPFCDKIYKPVADFIPSKINKYIITDKNIQIAVIIGHNNSLFWGKLLLSPESDGRVEPESALSEDAVAVAELPFRHNLIHKTNETAELVKTFLLTGKFFQDAGSRI